MADMMNPKNIPEKVPQEDAYKTIRGYVINAQQRVYTAVNVAMVETYWNIGKEIYEICGENDRAAYGKQVLNYISEKLTAGFGRGFDVSNLRNMRRFYLAFPKQDALRPELSWTHYRLLMKVPDKKVRNFYMQTVEELRKELNLEDFEKLQEELSDEEEV